MPAASAWAVASSATTLLTESGAGLLAETGVALLAESGTVAAELGAARPPGMLTTTLTVRELVTASATTGAIVPGSRAGKLQSRPVSGSSARLHLLPPPDCGVSGLDGVMAPAVQGCAVSAAAEDELKLAKGEPCDSEKADGISARTQLTPGTAAGSRRLGLCRLDLPSSSEVGT
eukprot:5301007-Prymnesium_polylepis.1